MATPYTFIFSTKKRLFPVVISCLFACGISAAPVHDFERVWTTAPGVRGVALAFGNQSFIAVGFGLSAFSADGGYSWTGRDASRPTLAIDLNARDSISGFELGVTVDKNGQTFESSLGWEVDRVALGNGIFMAAGVRWGPFPGRPSPENDWFSLDGRNWKKNESLPYLAVADLIFRDGYFYFLGADPFSNNFQFQMYRTLDSTTSWTKVYESPSSSLSGHPISEYRMKYAEGEFTAVCSDFIATSTNGTEWQSHPQPIGSPMCAAVRIKDGYLAAGRHGFFFSPNLTNWTTIKSDWFVDVVYAEGTAVALRQNGEIYRCNYEPHLSARTEGNDLILQVFATAPDRYAIEKNDTLLGSEWIKIDEILDLRVRSQKRITNFRTAPAAYYRLRKI